LSLSFRFFFLLLFCFETPKIAEMLRRVALRASVALGAMATAAYVTHAHLKSANTLILAQESPTAATSPAATARAPPPPPVSVVSDSETVSAKYLIVGGGVAALHAVAAIREL
jgi:hypothetical protein